MLLHPHTGPSVKEVYWGKGGKGREGEGREGGEEELEMCREGEKRKREERKKLARKAQCVYSVQWNKEVE